MKNTNIMKLIDDELDKESKRIFEILMKLYKEKRIVNKLFSVITINPRQTRRIPTAYPCAGLLSLKYFIDVVKVLKLTDVPKNTGTAYALIELANTSKNVLSIAGATIGSVILVKILLLGVFNIVAASSKLASMFFKIPPTKI